MDWAWEMLRECMCGEKRGGGRHMIEFKFSRLPIVYRLRRRRPFGILASTRCIVHVTYALPRFAQTTGTETLLCRQSTTPLPPQTKKSLAAHPAQNLSPAHHPEKRCTENDEQRDPTQKQKPRSPTAPAVVLVVELRKKNEQSGTRTHATFVTRKFLCRARDIKVGP